MVDSITITERQRILHHCEIPNVAYTYRIKEKSNDSLMASVSSSPKESESFYFKNFDTVCVICETSPLHDWVHKLLIELYFTTCQSLFIQCKCRINKFLQYSIAEK